MGAFCASTACAKPGCDNRGKPEAKLSVRPAQVDGISGPSMTIFSMRRSPPTPTMWTTERNGDSRDLAVDDDSDNIVTTLEVGEGPSPRLTNATPSAWSSLVCPHERGEFNRSLGEESRWSFRGGGQGIAHSSQTYRCRTTCSRASAGRRKPTQLLCSPTITNLWRPQGDRTACKHRLIDGFQRARRTRRRDCSIEPVLTEPADLAGKCSNACAGKARLRGTR